MIEAVTLYKCPETGKLWPTEKQAKQSATRAKAREKKREEQEKAKAELQREITFRRDYIRLNAESPKHAMELLMEKSEEFWGIKFIKNTLEYISWTKSVNGNYLVSGRISLSGKITCQETCDKYWPGDNYWESISDFLRFIRFDTGGGCGGRLGHYEFSMEVKIPLDSFPKLNDNYLLFKSETDKKSKRVQEIEIIRAAARKLAGDQKEYEDIEQSVRELELLCNDLHKKLSVYASCFSDHYLNIWMKENPAPQLNSHILELFENVR